MGWDCQLLFGIIPLCHGIEADFVKRGTLVKFQPCFFPSYTKYQWRYDRTSESSVQSCIKEIIEFIQQFLIPYFECGNNCASAYEENRKIYIHLYEKQGIMGFEKHGFVGDFPEYCMALKTRKYDWAKQYLEELIDERRNDLNYEIAQKKVSQEYIERETDFIAKRSAILERIAAHDTAWINNFIETNERKSRIALGLEPEPDG
jgi:hypothetical protein